MPARIDDEKRELIKTDYVVMGSMNKVAKKHNVSWDTVRNIISENVDVLQDQRNERKKQFIDDAWEVATMYLENLKNPKNVKNAKARDSATVYGILVDKIQKDQELWLKFDMIWEQVYATLEQTMITFLNRNDTLRSDFQLFLKEERWEIYEGAKEMFENEFKKVIELADKNKDMPAISKADAFSYRYDEYDCDCKDVYEYEKKIRAEIERDYQRIAGLLANKKIAELVAEYKKRHE